MEQQFQIKLAERSKLVLKTEENKPQNTKKIPNDKPEQSVSHSIFDCSERHLVLFAYNKQKDENSPQQIMVLEQPKKKLKQETEAQAINNMMANISLQPHTEEKLFLKKVDPLERIEIAQEIKEMLSFSNKLSLEDRQQRRRQIFQSSKARKNFDFASEEVLATRTIRVVKMDSLIEGGSIRGVVQLGGKSVQYEDLNIVEGTQEYYTLIKRKVRADEIFPQVEMERQQLYGISYEPDQPIKEQDAFDDDDDSNASDNPNYDYPEESESERSSEGIIEGDEDDLYMNQEEYEEDEEMLYQRYLRRERKKEIQQQSEMEVEPEYQEYD